MKQSFVLNKTIILRGVLKKELNAPLKALPLSEGQIYVIKGEHYSSIWFKDLDNPSTNVFISLNNEAELSFILIKPQDSQ